VLGPTLFSYTEEKPKRTGTRTAPPLFLIFFLK